MYLHHHHREDAVDEPTIIVMSLFNEETKTYFFIILDHLFHIDHFLVVLMQTLTYHLKEYETVFVCVSKSVSLT